MPVSPAPIRPELLRFGSRKRVGGFAFGIAVLGLRFANLLKSRATDKRLLILEPFGLGDMVSLEPLVRTAGRCGYMIGLCGKPEWRSLYPEDATLKWLDADLPWATHDESNKYLLKHYTSTKLRMCLRELRNWGTGAIGIDTRGDIRSVAVLHLAGCKRVLALENYLGSNLLVTPGSAERIDFDHRLRRWEMNLRFLHVLNPSLNLTEIARPRFKHLMTEKRTKQKRVGILPVAPWRGKWWNWENWQSLIAAVQARNMEVVGLCGPGQRKLAEAQLLGSVPVQESTSMEAWGDGLCQCDVVVSLDSGPMHLADALGIPTVALFGQGQLPLWAPSGPRSVVIAHQSDADFVSCQPVNENIASGQKFMGRITVAEVTHAIKSISGEW
jgi:heptosyltransferase III